MPALTPQTAAAPTVQIGPVYPVRRKGEPLRGDHAVPAERRPHFFVFRSNDVVRHVALDTRELAETTRAVFIAQCEEHGRSVEELAR
jgi:hypothetical protein